MKTVRRLLQVFLLGGVVAFTCTVAMNRTAKAVTIDTVPVGNLGNANDSTGFGGVGYAYRIGTYEVTNSQYVEFLNFKDATGANSLGLYNAAQTSTVYGGIDFTAGNANGAKYSVKSGRADNPVVYVSFYDSIRFANWLHNGQGTGDTETGAYSLLVASPAPPNGNSITRNAGATWVLPSENEWYKAAYHKNDGATGNYWDYPTSTDATPYSDEPPGGDAPTQSNTANYFKFDGNGITPGYDDGFAVTGIQPFDIYANYLTNVGAYSFSLNPYGTFDQGGNVYEWNEALPSGSPQPRGQRGGAWFSSSEFPLLASERTGRSPVDEQPYVGFRVVNVVPEPSTFALAALGVLGVMAHARLWARSSANQAKQGLATHDCLR